MTSKTKKYILLVLLIILISIIFILWYSQSNNNSLNTEFEKETNSINTERNQIFLKEGERVRETEYSKYFPDFLGASLGDAFGDFILSSLEITNYDYMRATFEGETLVSGEYKKIAEWDTIWFTVTEEDKHKIPLGKQLCFSNPKLTLEQMFSESQRADILTNVWHNDISGSAIIRINNAVINIAPKGGSCGVAVNFIEIFK